MSVVTDFGQVGSALSALGNVPVVGSGFAAAGMLLQSMDQLRLYREQCRNLHSNALSLLVSIKEQSEREIDNPAVRDAASEIEGILLEVHGKMTEWNKMGRVKAFLNKDEIRRELSKAEGRLEMATIRFSMTTQLEMVRTQELQKQFARSFADSQANDMADLKDMLRHIISDREDMNYISTRMQPTEVQTIMKSLQQELRSEVPPEGISGSSTEERHGSVFETGLKELRMRTGVLPPLTNLTGEIVKIGHSPIARGLTSDVWLGEWLGEKVALKGLRNIGEVDKSLEARFQREVDIWRTLQHRNVLRLYGVCYFDGMAHLVSPFAVNRNALDYLKAHPDTDRVKLLADAAQGLAYLHTRERPVIQGDLRAANILILENGEACVSDFGLARLEEMSENVTSTSLNTAGACRWMAPEIIDPKLVYRSRPVPTTATDVWSFGMTAYELFSGQRPYKHQPMDLHVMQDIARQWRHPRPVGNAESRDLTDEIWQTILQCWEQDPTRRPKMQEVAQVFTRYAFTSGDGRLRSRSTSSNSGVTMASSSNGHRYRLMTSVADPGAGENGHRSSPPVSRGTGDISRQYAIPFHTSPQPLPLTLEEDEHAAAEYQSFLSDRLTIQPEPEPASNTSTPALAITIGAEPVPWSSPAYWRQYHYSASPATPSSGSSRGTGHSASEGSSLPQSAPVGSTLFAPPTLDAVPPVTRTRSGTLDLPQVRTSDPPRHHHARPSTGNSTSHQSAVSVNSSTNSPLPAADIPLVEPTGPLEVRLSPDGRMPEAGTLEGLINFMLITSARHRDFRYVFFVTYEAFASDEDVLDTLMSYFKNARTITRSVDEKVRLRFTILEILHLWLWCHPLNGRTILLRRMRSFVNNIAEPASLAAKAVELSQFISPIMNTPMRSSEVLQSSKESIHSISSRSPPEELKWSALSDADIAAQLTIIHGALFKAVTVPDCVAYLEKLDGPNAVSAMLEKNRQLVGWVQSLVMKGKNADQRAKVIVRFISIAQECNQQGNCFGASAIVAALRAVVVDRLQISNKRVDATSQQTLQSLASVYLDHHDRAYRKMLEDRENSGPLIPVLHVHLRDAKATYKAIPATIQGDPDQLINFVRYSKMLKALKTLMQYQRSDFPKAYNNQYLRCIDRQLRSVEPGDELEQSLEKMSLTNTQQEKSDGSLLSRFRPAKSP